jgi:hypothetical protein
MYMPESITLPKLSPKETELKRCKPCYWCGGKPVVTRHEHKDWPKWQFSCENLKNSSHKGSCRNHYFYVDKHYDNDEKKLFSSFRKSWNAYQTGSCIKWPNTDNAYSEAYIACREKFKVDYDRNNLEHELCWEKAFSQKAFFILGTALGKVNGNVRKLKLALSEKKKKISSLQIEIDRLKAKVKKLENENNQIRSSSQG